MAIDFSLSPELEEIRLRVRTFVDDVITPAEARIEESGGEGEERLRELIEMRKQAHSAGIWLPHMPEEWGGMGLGHVELAMVQAEAARSYYGPWVFNCQAPDEGNMHTLLHWATDDQKDKYLKPLCEGRTWSCFAMTEPEVAGSDPTLIRTNGYQDGEEWVLNGHKWFISNAHRATFAILIARTEDDPDLPRPPTRPFWWTFRTTAGPRCDRSRPCTAPPATPRSLSRTCGSTMPRCWAAEARVTCWASTG